MSIFPPTPRRTHDGTVMLPESMQHREADGIKHRVRGIEVIEEHDKEAVVGQLVEFCGLGLVVLQEHVGNCHQHLCGGGGCSVRDKDEENNV